MVNTVSELCDYFQLDLGEVKYILYKNDVNDYYENFTIPKKNGGVREINASKGLLKVIQRQISNVLYSKNDSNTNISHAFKRGKTIISNARVHKNKKYIIKIDLKNFFNTINFGRVKGYFEKNKNFQFGYYAAVALAQLTCFKGHLPQGAPSSPIISDLIFQIIDFRILKIAKKYKLDYTRYADDLIFSTNDKKIVDNFNSFCISIENCINKSGFSLNEKKTRLIYKTSKQLITGLVVNKKVNVDNIYYKKIRAMTHRLYTKGSFFIDNNEGTLNQLDGMMSFVNYVLKKGGTDNDKNHNIRNLSGREKVYQQFLFYKLFFDNKPILVTEGKTDVVYIKAALKKYHKNYPELISVDSKGNFHYKISFLNRKSKLMYYFGLATDGADSIAKLYSYFFDNSEGIENLLTKLIKLTGRAPKNPVMLLFDNELVEKEKPICKFLSKFNIRKGSKPYQDILLKNNLKIHERNNVYILTIPSKEGKSIEIEDLFDDSVLNVEIKGLKFNRKCGSDTDVYFGKNTFSKHIIRKYSSIDFSEFIPLLDNIKNSIINYHEISDNIINK